MRETRGCPVVTFADEVAHAYSMEEKKETFMKMNFKQIEFTENTAKIYCRKCSNKFQPPLPTLREFNRNSKNRCSDNERLRMRKKASRIISSYYKIKLLFIVVTLFWPVIALKLMFYTPPSKSAFCSIMFVVLNAVIICVLLTNVKVAGSNITSIHQFPNSTRDYARTQNSKNSHAAAISNDDRTHVISHHFADRNATERQDSSFNGGKVASEHTWPPKTPTYARHLEETSIIFALARMANESLLNAGCYKALRHIERSILLRDPWAMKVLDASGTKPAGFIFGQNFWLGSRESCGAATKPIGITLSKEYQRNMNRGLIEDVAPFAMDYRVLYLRHNSPWQVEIKLMSERIVHIGLCLPTVCSAPEVQRLAQECLLQHRFVDLADLYDAHAEVLYMKDLKLSESFYRKKSLKLFGSFAIFTCAMMLGAAIMTVKPQAARKQQSVSEDLSEGELQSFQLKTKAQRVRRPLGLGIFELVKDFVGCYDVSENCRRLFSTRPHTSNEIPVINGLRSISAVWIMLFHVLWYMYFTVDNKPFMISHAERVLFQYVSSAPLLVDAFFTISGFLQTHNFTKNVQLMERIRSDTVAGNVRSFLKIVCHRYLRLAPLYFVIMGVVDLLSAYTQDVSVFHIHDRFDQICSRYWWRNVLFIQNLFDHEEMCVNWTWSLACEMQFFILATILLFIYARYPRCAKLIIVTALTSTVGWSFLSGMAVKFQLSFDVTFATGTQIYINPLVRSLPYILGTIAGCFLTEHRHMIALSPLQEKCLWNLAILVCISCIYSTFRRDISYLSAISLFVVGRLLFSLAVCWMIVGSATGRGSWWSRILEARLFQHVNRLTYAFYLLNPFVIALFFGLAETSTHVDPLMLCVLATGFAVMVYLAAIVFSLAFEMPYCNWSALMLKRGNAEKVA